MYSPNNAVTEDRELPAVPEEPGSVGESGTLSDGIMQRTVSSTKPANVNVDFARSN